MDLQCRVTAEGGHCYLDHLPLLGILVYESLVFVYNCLLCICVQVPKLQPLHLFVLEIECGWKLMILTYSEPVRSR